MFSHFGALCPSQPRPQPVSTSFAELIPESVSNQVIQCYEIGESNV